jgi:nucleoside-diphosphate-sugar epimerase
MQSGKQVCITGSSGYIGSWVTKAFLEDGRFSVRGTVRDPNDETKVKRLKDALGEEAKNLELVAADLTDPESLNKAFEGVEYVIHVASPISHAEPENEDDFLGPAVGGTENVINA